MAGYQEDIDFVDDWCDKYGLDTSTAKVFKEEKLDDLAKLIALSSEDINNLKIANNQKAILRGALLQFRQNDLETQMAKAKTTNSTQAKALAKAVKTFQVVKEMTKSQSDGEINNLPSIKRKQKKKKVGGKSLAEMMKEKRDEVAQSQMTTFSEPAPQRESTNERHLSAPPPQIAKVLQKSNSCDYPRTQEEKDREMRELEELERKLDEDLANFVNELPKPKPWRCRKITDDTQIEKDEYTRTLEMLDQQLFDDDELEMIEKKKAEH